MQITRLRVRGKEGYGEADLQEMVVLDADRPDLAGEYRVGGLRDARRHGERRGGVMPAALPRMICPCAGGFPVIYRAPLKIRRTKSWRNLFRPSFAPEPCSEIVTKFLRVG